MCGNLLVMLGMPTPDRGINDANERELQRERECDKNSLTQLVRTNVPLLNPQQKEMYDTVMKAIDDGNHKACFSLMRNSSYIIEVRARSEIAVAVASSGISGYAAGRLLNRSFGI